MKLQNNFSSENPSVYSPINSFLIPNFLNLQRSSFQEFLKNGLITEFQRYNPIKNSEKTIEIFFHAKHYRLHQPKWTPKQAILKRKSYSCPLFMPIQLTNLKTEESSIQWLFVANLPLMTKHGHFILNGSPRVIMNQMIRSPGVYFKKTTNTSKKEVYYADFIAQRGAWLRLEVDTKTGDIWAKLKKTPKIPVFIFLRSLGLSLPILNSFIDLLKLRYLLQLDAESKRKTILRHTNLKLGPFSEDSVKTPQLQFLLKDLRDVLKQRLNKKKKRAQNQRDKEEGLRDRKRIRKYIKKYSDIRENASERFLEERRILKEERPILQKELDAQPRTKKRVKQLEVGLRKIVRLLKKSDKTWFELVPKILREEMYYRIEFEKAIEREEKTLETFKRLWKKDRVRFLDPKWDLKKLNDFLAIRTALKVDFTLDLSKKKSALLSQTEKDVLDTQERGLSEELDKLERIIERRKKQFETFQLLLKKRRGGQYRNLKDFLPINNTSLIDYSLAGCFVPKSTNEKDQKRVFYSREQEESLSHLSDKLFLFFPEKTFFLKRKVLSQTKRDLVYRNQNENLSHLSDILFPTLPEKTESSPSPELSLGLLPEEEDFIESPITKAQKFLFRRFLNSRTYDFSPLGRLRINKKLGLSIPLQTTTLTAQDVIFTCFFLMDLLQGERTSDDIDDLKNRKIQPSGELIQTQLAIGLSELEKRIKEKFQEPERKTFLFADLVNVASRPINQSFREFFGTSPLSQLMDQTNPLAELTHKRRLSSLGPGGIERETAGMSIRGIHPTHYGRICPIETPEGQNAGLVNSITTYAQFNKKGFLETPFYKAYKGFILKNMDPFLLSSDQENLSVLAPGDIPFSKFHFVPKNIELPARYLKEFKRVSRNTIDFISLSPIQMISVATSLIPFLEHDDGNRALMGSNMQRQAISTLRLSKPIVGTGLESRAISDVGHNLQAKKSGFISYVDGKQIHIYSKNEEAPFFGRFSISSFDWNGNNFGKSLLRRRSKRAADADKRQERLKVPKFRLFQKKKEKFFLWANKSRFFPCPSLLLGQKEKTALPAKVTAKGNKYEGYKPKTLLQTSTPSYDTNKEESRLFYDQSSNNLTLSKYNLDSYFRSNQDTYTVHRPLVKEGQWVEKGDSLADGSSSKQGELALGQNLLVGYTPWEGYNFEDAVLISERVVFDDLYTSLHIERYEVEVRDTSYGLEQITNQIPNAVLESAYLDDNGIAKIGTWVKENDILVGKIAPLDENQNSPYRDLLYDIIGKERPKTRDTSLRAPKGVSGRVIHIEILETVDKKKVYPLSSNSRNLFPSKSEEKSKKKKARFSNLSTKKMPEPKALFRKPLLPCSSKTLAFATTQVPSKNFFNKPLLFLTKKQKQPTSKIVLKTISPGVLRNIEAREILRLSKKRKTKSFVALALAKVCSNTRVTSKKIPKSSPKVDFVPSSFVAPPSGYFVPKAKDKKKSPTPFLSPVKVHIYLAEKRKLQLGDKIAGRHGNKGIVSNILPRQDMPYLPDGTPLDIVLNPLGVPSRMNVGQIFECLLGLAGYYLKQNYKIRPFDEIYGSEASRSLVYSKLYEARCRTGQSWLFNPNFPGKTRLFDGRTGECFQQPVTVGVAYILKLVHLVDHKIHARSTGPYSLVTQQPLRGRSKQGGQRVGEMEVWALEGFGAAYILQEILTIKSDDLEGRDKVLRCLLNNKPIKSGIPESFKVLVRELQSLCLDIVVFKVDKKRSRRFKTETTRLTI